MTREEAIDVLKKTIAYESDFAEAKRMAITALSADAVGYETTATINEPISIQSNYVYVVRCKDCKHYIVEGITTQYGWCHEYKHSVNEDDYCSYGERQCNYFGERREP